MKKYILFLFLTFAFTCVQAQTNSAAVKVETVETLTKTATKTNEIYTDAKGVKYEIYTGAKGGRFIIRKSGKTGNLYKYYLPK